MSYMYTVTAYSLSTNIKIIRNFSLVTDESVGSNLFKSGKKLKMLGTQSE